ncbi:hypothetical protein MIN45_P0883 [Methylomarinovum tepidoasis]|uniref:Uncharacterized protein n=1 Tax=Methylomarinovum tepidoasis TaxID=2840183 RepID=A0AAU9CWH9_9GAMM|nr:hypothetical protein [Methylomarinovum sp. IN45]BCX88514.1 hypothetical protein MIN45_P0883 [Methylomarinovum sp. IN45]
MAEHKHITEPDPFGYQVRIVRRGVERSRYFSHKLWGGKRKSLQAAIRWRDQMLVILKGSRTRFMKTPRNKISTGVTGVSRTIKYDKRKDKSYLCYTVFWIKDGKPRNKTFQVGNVKSVTADQELHAYRTAVAFRKAYEYAIDHDYPFDDTLFRNWKRIRLYEPPEEGVVRNDRSASSGVTVQFASA